MGDSNEVDLWEVIKTEGIFIELKNTEDGDTLDSSNRSFLPGQIIEGNVILKTYKDVMVKEIILKFEGNGRIYGSPKRDKKTAAAEYKELKAKIVLLGKTDEQVATDTNLQPGTHKYPFSYTLPNNLPLSFHCPKWALCYFIEARMITKQETSQTYVLPFHIKGTLDLNGITGLDQRAELSKEKHFCCGCYCGHRCTVRLTVMLLRRGFIPGEFVDFLFEIENLGHRTVTDVTVRLVQNVIATSGGGYKKLLENIIAETKGWEVPPESTDFWRGERVLQIPEVPPTKMDGYRNIGLEYDFQIEVAVSGCGKNYKGNIPIVIGTVPLKSFEKHDNLYGSYQVQTMSLTSIDLSSRESSHTGPMKNAKERTVEASSSKT